MKGVKTPPPSSKGGKKSSTSTPAANASGPEDAATIICALQPRSDDVSVDRCMVPSSFIKRIGSPRLGSYVLITFPNGLHGLFAIWPHAKQKVTADAASFHKVWGPCFESKDVQSPGSNKFVTMSSKHMNRVRVVKCTSFSCKVFDNRNRFEEIRRSAAFRSILKSYLNQVHVIKGLRFSMTFQGSPVIVMIHQTVSDADAEVAPAAVEPNPTSDEEEPTTETPTSILTFYRIHKDTEIVVVDQSDGDLDPEAAATSVSEQQLTTVTSPVHRSTVCQWSVTDVVQSIRKSFAGYDKEVNVVADLVVNGLSARAKQNRPKGVILCGPPGTGKSTLAQSLLEALRCNVKYLDHSLLLRVLEGEAETMLRQCFDDAARIPPCCIVMENMELLLPSRSASTTTFLQKRITSCWLSLMDELAAGVVVVGVTSHVNDVDAAARRAGRMEREVEISVPTPADRLFILTHLFQQAGTRLVPAESSTFTTATTAESDLESIESYAAEIAEPLVQQTAAAAHGTVGADLLTLVKEIFYQNVVTSSTGNDDMASVTGGMEALSVATRPVTQITDVAVRSALRKISPSALREVVVEVPTVYWSDIGGMQEVKQALQQVVEWPLKHPDWYASLQIGPLKGMLLYGPPGCSKTLMAKAVATESSMNFLAVRGPELLSKWLGESEKAVQALFRRARAAAPAIIFFDEIDALAGVRGESSSGVSDRVLAQLLTELDGIEALKQVVVIAATNRPDMLDPALIRPGRIDRKIYVPPPDAESRRSILTIELGKMPTAAVVATVDDVMDEDMIWLDEIVEISEGFSGAEVVALCSEAALLAVENEETMLSRRHLIQAASKMKPQITSEMLQFYDNFRSKHR